MEKMTALNCVLTWHQGRKAPSVQIEEPNEIQAKVLAAFGYEQ